MSLSRRDAWLFSYGLLGLTQSELVPVLMPLIAPHGLAAGLTYAAFSLLGVFAPFIGFWADRTGRYRDLLVWGTLGAGVLFLLFDASASSWRILFAAGAGLGSMAATTAGNVIAIQGVPEDEWDDRVALLQRFMSGGQVMGLVCAGLIARARPVDGLLFAGVVLLTAGVLALFSAPSCPVSVTRAVPRTRATRGGDAGVPAAHQHAHHLPWRQFRAWLSVLSRPMRCFLLIWLVAYPAMNGFATLFPVAMVHQYGMDPILPAGAYAIGVAASLWIYARVGVATHRFGGGRMLRSGLVARLLLLGLLAVLGLPKAYWAGWLILIGFALIQFVWPLLAVATSSLAVRLAPGARGESIGLLNAATSLATTVGSALAGVINASGGFAILSATAFCLVGVGLMLNELWLGTIEAAEGHPVVPSVAAASTRRP